MSNEVLKLKQNDVPYGCLKNGQKKTYREWKELNNNNIKIDVPDIIRPPTPPPPPKLDEVVQAEVSTEANKKGKKSAGKKKEPVKANLKPGSGKLPKTSATKARGILKSDGSNSGNKKSKNVEIAKPEEPKTVQIMVEPVTPTQIDTNAIKEVPATPNKPDEIKEIIINFFILIFC